MADKAQGGAEEGDCAADVLSFWFDEVPADKRFAKDDELDRKIAARFGGSLDTLLETQADGWRDMPDRLLAAIVALDQFSRNIHRGTARAFAADPLALSLTQLAIGQGWEEHYAAEQRQFLYLPLMHAEDAQLQALSVAKFEALSDADALAFARDHCDVVRRFGRFPSRNIALGRASTPAEQDYLARREAGR